MAIIILLIIAVLCLVFGIKGVKKQKAQKAEIKKDVAETARREASTNTIEFVLAAIPHHLDAVMALADPEEDFSLSLKKLDEEHPGEKVFRYWFRPVPCSIVPEPENPVDPHALRVDAAGDTVGYIRQVDTEKVRAVLAGRFGAVESCSVSFEGGPYKMADLDDDGELVLVKDEDPIYGTVTIKAVPADPRDASPVILTAKDITL